MTDVIIIGAGGHGAEIDEYIRFSIKNNGKTEISVYGFLDDNPENYARYRFSAPLIGSVRDHIVKKHGYYLIAIADSQIRKSLAQKFKNEDARFITYIDSRAYVSESASVGEGCIIGPYVNIGPNVRVGKFNLINSRASLGHDTIIGDFNIISPNVCLSGFTSVENENLFGINCASIPGIKIGSRNKVAAGMIIDQNIGDETVVFYRYKEKVIAVPKKVKPDLD